MGMLTCGSCIHSKPFHKGSGDTTYCKVHDTAEPLFDYDGKYLAPPLDCYETPLLKPKKRANNVSFGDLIKAVKEGVIR